MSGHRNDRIPAAFGAHLVAGTILVLLVAATPLLGGDPPHWIGAVENIDCTSNCHVTHHALGGGLNPQTGNTNLCQSCHSSNSLPIDSGDKATPGVGGTSHGFDVSPTSPAFGADTPANQEMALRLLEGNVVCSTCHNQHAAEAANRGRPRISDAQKVQNLGGTGTLASGGTYSGTVGLWYLIDITAAGSEATARFRYSKDNGISWSPTDCAPGNLGPCLTASTSPVALDNGVEVTFTGAAGGAFLVGEQSEFSASYPFLRIPMDRGDINAVDKFCRDCHEEWVMTHDSDLVGGGGVGTWDGNFKSHPVGVGLNANGKGYDRAIPLDGNGAPQGDPGADANPTNDLDFDDLGNVQCLSCHGVHYADSNTLTVDEP